MLYAGDIAMNKTEVLTTLMEFVVTCGGAGLNNKQSNK